MAFLCLHEIANFIIHGHVSGKGQQSKNLYYFDSVEYSNIKVNEIRLRDIAICTCSSVSQNIAQQMSRPRTEATIFAGSLFQGYFLITLSGEVKNGAECEHPKSAAYAARPLRLDSIERFFLQRSIKALHPGVVIAAACTARALNRVVLRQLSEMRRW